MTSFFQRLQKLKRSRHIQTRPMSYIFCSFSSSRVNAENASVVDTNAQRHDEYFRVLDKIFRFDLNNMIKTKRKDVKEFVLDTGKDVGDIISAYGEIFLDMKNINIVKEGNMVYLGVRRTQNSVIIPVTQLPPRDVDGVVIEDSLDEKMVEVEKVILLALKDFYSPSSQDYSPAMVCVAKELFGHTKFEREKKRVAPVLLVPQNVAPVVGSALTTKKRIVPTLIDPISRAPLKPQTTEGERKELELLKHSKVLGPLLAKEGLF